MNPYLKVATGLIISCALSRAAFADVLIGIAGPITGPNAVYGLQLQKGAEQAAADINAAGGIKGEKITTELGDDASDPKQGVSVANKFVADGVQYVIGHYNSGISIPASEIYAENSILEITPASTNPTYTDRGLWNTLRATGRDDQQGAIAAKYIGDHFKDAKIAIVHDKQPYGQGLADETRKALNKAGVTEVIYEGITPGEKDYSALISKMKAAGVTFVYYGGYHPEAGLIKRQMRDLSLDATMMSGDGIMSNELAAIAGDTVDGVLMTFAPDPRKNPASKAVVEKFRQNGFEPEGYTLYSYASMQILVKAIEKSQTTDSRKLADFIKANGPFSTVIGDLSFDAKGDLTRPEFVVYKWVKGADGKYAPVEIGH